MTTLITLQEACSAESSSLLQLATEQAALWNNWLKPISADLPAGEDPGYDDDFQQMREEVNKLSGANTTLICELSEKLLNASCKDVRVATYYIWARLHRDGEAGFADGLSLLAALIGDFGEMLHPQRGCCNPLPPASTISGKTPLSLTGNRRLTGVTHSQSVRVMRRCRCWPNLFAKTVAVSTAS